MRTLFGIVVWLLLSALIGCAEPTLGPTVQATQVVSETAVLPATAPIMPTEPPSVTHAPSPTALATPIPIATAMATARPTPAVLPTIPSTDINRLGGKIVYDHEGDIYVMGDESLEPIQLTTDPEMDFDAEWSPDGKKIVFRSHRDGNEEIYVMDADGYNQTNLTNHPNGDWSPAWSVDGSKIAFASQREGRHGIWMMNADGSDPHPVATPPGVNDYPTWSPDSQQIAWNCTMGRMLDIPGQADFEICVVNADGSALRQLTDTEGNNKFPAWSPDGTKIAFVSDRNGWPTLPGYRPAGYDPENFGDEEIFLMNADGSEQRNLTDNPREGDTFPAWSPDGRLIYTRYGCLMVMNAEGSELTQLSSGQCTGTDSGGFPDWHQEPG